MKKERFIPQQATYTAKEAASYLKVSERQIRNFIAPANFFAKAKCR